MSTGQQPAACPVHQRETKLSSAVRPTGEALETGLRERERERRESEIELTGDLTHKESDSQGI